MAGLRRAVAFLLFHLGRTAERFARLMVYASAGTRQLTDMQKDNQQVWQAFYEGHPSHTSQLMSWEKECVDRFVRPDADVLLVGCGSGRDLVPLAGRGCRVTGIDPSENALAIAERTLRAHGLSATLIAGFFEDTPIDRTFDVVIFSYYSYSVIPMALRRIAALGKVASLLTTGGHVVISHATASARPHPVLVRLARLRARSRDQTGGSSPAISCGTIGGPGRRCLTRTCSKRVSSSGKPLPPTSASCSASR